MNILATISYNNGPPMVQICKSSSSSSPLGGAFALNITLFGWKGEGRRVEGSRVELTKNKLILY